ncbi:hypothetical protein QWM81_03155 [Streptomyces ficellus]|uniref:Antitoxin n=1 Tax=Streptomyces ficellus TaxID=1977088 RepID=A0ABT7Z0N6_9ACTN|nr:hypothetical protein [Streptomyces ficellus]MDN3293059.1 hypothetical protein [Streptomyces ficellus]
MGIADQFKDKSQEMKDQAKRRAQDAKREAQERTQKGRGREEGQGRDRTLDDEMPAAERRGRDTGYDV